MKEQQPKQTDARADFEKLSKETVEKFKQEQEVKDWNEGKGTPPPVKEFTVK